jgi:hypothetical protein
MAETGLNPDQDTEARRADQPAGFLLRGTVSGSKIEVRLVPEALQVLQFVGMIVGMCGTTKQLTAYVDL